MDAVTLTSRLADLDRDITRVASRLRAMSDVRLSQPRGRDGTRAAAALDLAQQLADAAQGVEDRVAPAPPRPRIVPDLGVFALGDQVAVTGRDLVSALRTVHGEEQVWWHEGRVSATDLLSRAEEAVRAVRLSL